MYMHVYVYTYIHTYMTNTTILQCTRTSCDIPVL